MIEGKYPVIGGGEKYGGYHNDYNYDDKFIFISRVGTAGHISKYNGKCYITDLVGAFNVKNKYNYDYIYYYLKSKQEEIQNKFVNKDAAPSINLTEFLEKYKLQIPYIEDQEAIIKEMEYFDNLKEMYQIHITNTEKQIKERFEYHLSKCKNAVLKDTNESKDDNVDSETEDEKNEEIIIITKSGKLLKSKKNVESDNEEEEKPTKTKSTKSSRSKIDEESETDIDDECEKPIKKSSKKINKSTKKH